MTCTPPVGLTLTEVFDPSGLVVEVDTPFGVTETLSGVAGCGACGVAGAEVPAGVCVENEDLLASAFVPMCRGTTNAAATRQPSTSTPPSATYKPRWLVDGVDGICGPDPARIAAEELPVRAGAGVLAKSGAELGEGPVLEPGVAPPSIVAESPLAPCEKSAVELAAANGGIAAACAEVGSTVGSPATAVRGPGTGVSAGAAGCVATRSIPGTLFSALRKASADWNLFAGSFSSDMRIIWFNVSGSPAQ